jgi:hypothetical protein
MTLLPLEQERNLLAMNYHEREITLMYKSAIVLLASAFVLGFVVFGCSDTTPSDVSTQQMSQSRPSTPRSLGKVLWGHYFDSSGDVEVAVWENTTYGEITTQTVDVDADFVLIGGGAWADYSNGQGALLTGSHPLNDQLTTWVAEAKDHLYVNYHTLHVYAVGLRLRNVSRSTLRNYMNYKTNTSGSDSHPSANATVDNGYRLIGGGAKVNWSGQGNLLTESYPYSDITWRAVSKDHYYVSPATITAYAIGITTGSIPGFGTLVADLGSTGTATVSSGVASASTNVRSGYVFSCFGGRSTYASYGRLLTRIGPNPNQYTNILSVSKDHYIPDGGTTYAYYLEIKKQ